MSITGDLPLPICKGLSLTINQLKQNYYENSKGNKQEQKSKIQASSC